MSLHSSVFFYTLCQNFYMKELVERLMALGLTETQAYQSIDAVKEFAKEKFPIFSGALDKLFDKYGPKTADSDEDYLA